MKKDIEREELTKAWQQAYSSPCPKNIPKPLLALMLGWHQQMQSNPTWQGKAGRTKLRRMLSGDTRAELRPGMRLVREWQGEVYQVLVLPKGFEMNGRVFKSLSAIARHITGTAWSGPLFFGLYIIIGGQRYLLN